MAINGTGYFTNYMKLSGLWLLSFFCFLACQPMSTTADKAQANDTLKVAIAHFPKMPIPANRPLTAKRIALGKKLFNDPILSRNQDLSCASCHHANKAFTDGRPVSLGTQNRKTARNAPTLYNVAWQPYLFMDGGNPTLESQMLGPIEAHNEMDLPFTEAMARVANQPKYQALFKAAFADEVNPFTLTTAIATYERSLVSANSAFDRYYYKKDLSALSQSAQRGLQLFTSPKLKCQSCHALPLTTSFAFKNNGFAPTNPAEGGRANITMLAQDSGKFKVPTLRNIALTAPYMHNGTLTSLAQVIDHYAQGGSGTLNQSPLVKGFEINAQEKEDLIAFLQALTDTTTVIEGSLEAL